MSKHVSLLALCLVGLIGLAPHAEARNCPQLRQAQQRYDSGRFAEAIRLGTECLEGGSATAAERERAYRLIGLSYIGQDLSDSAREVVGQLVSLVPSFEPDPVNDPPQFVRLVEEMKQEYRASQAPKQATNIPNVRAQPLYGTATLRAGFSPDPYEVQVVAGGNSQNPIAGTGCVGYLNMVQPDIDLNYTAGSYPLTITAESGTDTALLINQPDGSWVCDDDSGGNANPMVRFSSPQSGNYNVWVTTYNANAQAPATIRITEQNAAPTPAPTPTGTQPDVGAQPLYGTLNLSAGFNPDPQIVNVQAGGSAPNPISGTGCAGYINASQPDIDLNYSAGSYPLYIYVRASSDTTLLVNLPDGSWVCSDDASGRDPVVHLAQPQSGNYNVWVGTYSAGTTQQAGIYLSEVAPN